MFPFPIMGGGGMDMGMGGAGMGLGMDGIPPPFIGGNPFGRLMGGNMGMPGMMGGGMDMPGIMGGMPMGAMGAGGCVDGMGCAPAGPPFGMPRRERASFAGGRPMSMGMGIGMGMPGGDEPFEMPQQRGRMPMMGGMPGVGGRGGHKNFDPSRHDAPKTPRGRRPSFGARAQTPGANERQGRSARRFSPRSPGFGLRPDEQGVHFQGHHEGVRFGEFDAPADLRNVRPHQYGLRPEARPRTVGEIFRGGDVPNQGFVMVKKMKKSRGGIYGRRY